MGIEQTHTITGTSPAAASTAQVGSQINGLLRFTDFTIHANLLGATDGTLNVRLQRKIATDVWSDWVSFPQLAAAAAAISYAVTIDASTGAIAAVGGGTDSTPTVALAANTLVGGHPGSSVRMVCTAGVGTSAGAAQTIYIKCHRHR